MLAVTPQGVAKKEIDYW